MHNVLLTAGERVESQLQILFPGVFDDREKLRDISFLIRQKNLIFENLSAKSDKLQY